MTETSGLTTEPEFWAIHFEDAAVSPDVFTEEESARSTFKRRSDNWNCYLFGPANEIDRLRASLSEKKVDIDHLRSVVRLAASMSIGTPDVLACKEAAQAALGGEDRG